MITIAWDVDDVLNNLTESWLNWYNTNMNTKYKFCELIENPPYKILNITYEDYIKSLDEFRMSDEAKNMPPNKKIINWMKENEGRYNHIVLTATSAHTVYNSAYWVFKNFYKYIHSFNIVPAKRDYKIYSKYANKKEFLLDNKNIKFFIDDNFKNIEDANQSGVKGYLLKTPWNNGIEIEKILEEINKEKE